MKKLAKIIGIIFSGAVVAAGGVVGFLYLRKPAMQPAREIRIERTPERLARVRPRDRKE